jgi:hypothetical protein
MSDDGLKIRPVPSFNFDINQLLDAYKRGRDWRNAPLRAVPTQQGQQPQQPQTPQPQQPQPVLPQAQSPSMLLAPTATPLANAMYQWFGTVPSQNPNFPSFDPTQRSSLY